VKDQWTRGIAMLFGLLMAWGGVMHFTVDQRQWNSELLDAMAESGFLWREIGIVNLVAGLALVSDRWAPLATLALLPITFNIFVFHLVRLDPFGLTIGVPVIVLNAVLVWAHFDVYRPLLRSSC
jgi:hypothetical protein